MVFQHKILRCLGWSMDSCIWARNWACFCLTTFLTRNPLCNEMQLRSSEWNSLSIIHWFVSCDICKAIHHLRYVGVAIFEPLWSLLFQKSPDCVGVECYDLYTRTGGLELLLQMLLHRVFFLGWQKQISVLVGRNPSTFWVLFEFVLMIHWCPTFAACSDLGKVSSCQQPSPWFQYGISHLILYHHGLG